MSEKRYFWLKLYDDFFTSKRIKKLRSIAGGDTYTIIYLKMQLKALKTEGYLYFDGIMADFAEELALDLDENPDDVKVTINFLLNVGLLESNNEEIYHLTYMDKLIGSESASAQRGKEYRASLTEEQKEKERERARLGMQKTRANRRGVTDCYEQVTNVDIEKEIDIEKRKSKRFIPPTLEDVKAYCQQRNNSVDPKKFFDYYEQGKWKDSKGNQVKNWKQKLITWENKEPKAEKPKTNNTMHFSNERTDIDFEALKRRAMAN